MKTLMERQKIVIDGVEDLLAPAGKATQSARAEIKTLKETAEADQKVADAKRKNMLDAVEEAAAQVTDYVKTGTVPSMEEYEKAFGLPDHGIPQELWTFTPYEKVEAEKASAMTLENIRNTMAALVGVIVGAGGLTLKQRGDAAGVIVPKSVGIY